MSKYLALIRAKHYIKNFLVFVPLIFSGGIFTINKSLSLTLLGVVIFSILSSTIYIINDIRDIERDKLHPQKCNRPLASGAISIHAAWSLASLCMFAVIALSIILSIYSTWFSFIFPLTYFLLNFGYSYGLKDRPLVEIAILASGFVLRILFGGVVSGVPVSDWLFLTIVCISFYLGLGKRRNELDRHGNKLTRNVLRHYSRSFLDKNMYMFLCLSIGFYSLWSIEHPNPMMLWSIPFVMLMAMRYSLRVEGSTEGDPVDMILNDRMLMCLGLSYGCFLMFILYC